MPSLLELGRTSSAMGAVAATSGMLGSRNKCGRGLGRGLLYSSLTQLSLPHLLSRCRRGLGRGPPRLSVSSALSSVGNLIASAGGSGAAHSAVSSAIAHVAVTAVAIASGACLSTKVDFLWPRGEDSPDCLVFEGVDVTGYSIFCDSKVQKAINFARKAHHGQQRKTGEPYVTHCIHTGKILAAIIPSNGSRAVNTIVAGILHDIVDDTFETLHTIQEEFGDDVAHLVAGVSKLSYINQLLRRNRRNNVSQSAALRSEEARNLRGMLLGMVDDPRVVLIKLADRLHNMRTIYALSLPKAQAVAEETLSVWCSLASRLGVWALKAELEDLCFAVLQPGTFREIRTELASMWNFKETTSRPMQMDEQMNHDSGTTSDQRDSLDATDEMDNVKDLLQAVLPFDLLLDRRKRSLFLNNLRKINQSDATCEVLTDAGIALSSLVVCEEALEREIFISTSYIPGMEVTLSSRLKSLYSIFCKMKRKDLSIKNVYDARALRVVVGDKNGVLHRSAVKNCYSLLNMVHKLWSPIDGEFDDYIINPKPSGYQSLHTAVQGPDSYPVEIQIRTQRMHEYAEFGLAAHWLYKETENKLKEDDSIHASSIYHSRLLGNERVQDDIFQKYRSLKAGHPVLRVEGSQLLSGVIVSIDQDGRELLVAVSFELEATEALTDRRYSIHSRHWEAHARLFKKVSDQWWFEPGHGDWSTCLEKYTLCRDGMYHKQDQFERLLPTFIQVIELTDKEEEEYRVVVSDVFEGKPLVPKPALSAYNARQNLPKLISCPVDSDINNKVLLLRTMLQWEEEVRRGASLNEMKYGLNNRDTILSEVVIIYWPHGEIMRIRSGSTAADAARRIGMEGKLVLVNGQLAVPQTELKDGDILEVRL